MRASAWSNLAFSRGSENEPLLQYVWASFLFDAGITENVQKIAAEQKLRTKKHCALEWNRKRASSTEAGAEIYAKN